VGLLMDIEKANWERIKQPSKNLRVLQPTPERLVDLSARLLVAPMFLADEHRNPELVDLLVAAMFSGPQLNLVYEIGEWAGVLAFQDIWPGYKADVSFLIWDNRFLPGAKAEQSGLRGKLCWGADFVRELRDIADLVMDEFKLKRLGMTSPEEHTVDIAIRFLGFKIEGHQKYGFRYNGKMLTQNLLRRVRKQEG